MTVGKESAQAWIASVGERGDWGRLHDVAAFLGHGLQLVFFSEPEAVSGDPARAALLRRAPWYVVMERRGPTAA